MLLSRSTKTTRNMRTTKPVSFPMEVRQTASLKICRLERVEGGDGRLWESTCAHDNFVIQPYSGDGDCVVLCEFLIKEVVSEWPVFQVRLSSKVEVAMTKLMAPPPLLHYRMESILKWSGGHSISSCVSASVRQDVTGRDIPTYSKRLETGSL